MNADDTLTSRSDFQTTHWSRLLIAVRSDSTRARAALADLCQDYWYPVYAFIRRRGYSLESAKDLTQEVFLRLLEKRALAAADPTRGRFRSFLRTCAQNLLNQHWHKDHALKRGGDRSLVSFDEAGAEARYAAEPGTAMSPEKLFERRWALDLLDRAMSQLEEEYARHGKREQFEALHVFLSGAKGAEVSYAEAGARLGLTEVAARQAAHRMRSRFSQLLRLAVSQTVTNSAELDEEMNHLRAILSE